MGEFSQVGVVGTSGNGSSSNNASSINLALTYEPRTSTPSSLSLDGFTPQRQSDPEMDQIARLRDIAIGKKKWVA